VGNGPLQPLLTPKAVHPVVVNQPALQPQRAIGHAPAPADVLGCDLAEATPHLVTWTPATEPVLMRASQPAELGQEKPHVTQGPHS